MCAYLEQQHILFDSLAHFGFAFYGIGLACLPSWPGMVNTDWLCSMRSEIFLQMKFIIFQGCPTKLGQPAPYNQLLIQPL